MDYLFFKHVTLVNYLTLLFLKAYFISFIITHIKFSVSNYFKFKYIKKRVLIEQLNHNFCMKILSNVKNQENIQHLKNIFIYYNSPFMHTTCKRSYSNYIFRF